jgi:hypothetical protein
MCRRQTFLRSAHKCRYRPLTRVTYYREGRAGRGRCRPSTRRFAAVGASAASPVHSSPAPRSDELCCYFKSRRPAPPSRPAALPGDRGSE